MTNEKMDRQVELEAEMRGLGIQRYREQLAKARAEGEEHTTSYGLRLLKAAIDPTAKAIASFLAEAQSGKPGKRHLAVKYLQQVDVDVAAFITGKVILDQITFHSTLTKTALAVSGMIEDEVRFRHFEGEKKSLWRTLCESVKTDHARHRRRVLVYAMNKAGVVWEDWPQTDKLHLGIKLVEMFQQATGLVEVVTRHAGRNNSKVFVEATPETMAWIEKNIESSEVLSPVYLPCIVAPRDWTSPYNGGYHTSAFRHLTLVKTRNHNYLEELNNRVDEMPAVYRTVNALQRTAWKVNHPVLEAMVEAWDRGLTIAGLPARDPQPMPPRTLPEDLEWDAMTPEQQEVLRAWKRRAAAIHESNAKLSSRRMQVAKIISIARKYEQEDELFFPYQLDFRGRIYAVPMFLNPQGADAAKGLLTFAHGKPIDDATAAGWLAIHGANLYGFDKVGLVERIDWVNDHQSRIVRAAADPFEDLWWADADKPWQFLAFCIEWTAFLREGYGFVSSLPIALDGSCNGLQHFSAALRDPVGGAAVNLVPSEKPSDIYQRVADVVIEKLEVQGEYADSEGDPVPEQCRKWLAFGITRKTTKRSVMVLPYGGTLFSCRDFIIEWYREQTEGGAEDVFGEKLFDAATFLSQVMWQSIGEVVVAARHAMDWLQKSARVLSKEGLPIVWTTPVGFPVMQAYQDVRATRVKTRFGESIMKLTVVEDIPELDARRQANGISPNWVHSLDASHLMLSVCIGEDHGINSWAMVHDSYGTVAADVDVMGQALRVAFFEMYRDHDVMAEFRNEVGALVSDEAGALPELPASGSLDLTQVLESDFFFA